MQNTGFRRRSVLLAGLTAVAGGALLPSPAFAASSTTTDSSGLNSSDQQIYNDIHNAFLFGYALVSTWVWMLPSTNVTTAGYDGAPINQIQLGKSIESAGLTDGPNLETVYAGGLLDLTAEPLILSKPAVDADRYFGILLTSGHGSVMPPLGTQGLGGQGAATYALCGPDFGGGTPGGVTRVSCYSNLVSMKIRMREFTDVGNDYATVDALQKRLDIRPLSQYGNPNYAPPQGTVNPAYDYDPFTENNSLSIVDFFTYYNQLAVHNPPESSYQSLAASFEEYNIGAGKNFTLNCFDSTLAAQLNTIPTDFANNFASYEAQYSYFANGWEQVDGAALEVGGDYRVRDVYFFDGPSVNPPPVFDGFGTEADSAGNALDGANTYQIHFDTLPPYDTGGFWCLIAYYGAEMDIPANAEGVYKIDDLTRLTTNSDGSTDIYLAPSLPTGAAQNNWLPTEAGAFRYVLRVYCPATAVTNGTWTAPYLDKIA
jgi:hypothetical protein